MLIFGAILLLYGNSLKNGYALDDELVTSTDRHKHPLVEKGISGIPAIFKSHYAVNPEQTYEYRPIPLATFAIERSVFRGIDNQVFYSHLIQVLLYALLGIVVYKTLLLMLDNYPTSLVLIITLLFLSLPIHTEVVNSLKNRDEILSLLFSLLALRYGIHYLKSTKVIHLFWVCLFFLLALLSKKTALPMLIIIPLLIYWIFNAKWKTIGAIVCALILARIGFVFLNKGLLKEPIRRSIEAVENPLVNTSWFERIPAFFQSFGFYFRQTLFPNSLHSYYGLGGYSFEPVASTNFLISFFLVLILIGFIVFAYFQKSYREATAGVLLFLIALAGANNLLFPMVGMVAERLAFTASLGLILAFTLLIYQILPRLFSSYWKPYVFTSTMIVLGGYYSALVIIRNPDWINRLTLFSKDAEGFDSAKAHALLGQECHEKVNEAFAKSKKINPEIQSLLKEEREAYEKALSIYPNYFKIESNLGLLYFSYFGESIKAFDCFNHSIKINPNNPSPHHLRVTLLQKTFSEWMRFKSEKQRFADTMSQYKNLLFTPAFEKLTRYENEGIQLTANGLTPEVIAELNRKASILETEDPLFKNTKPSFSAHVKECLQLMYSGKSPSFNMMDRYRFILIPEVEKKLNETIYKSLKESKTYLTPAELAGFKKLVHSSPSH